MHPVVDKIQKSVEQAFAQLTRSVSKFPRRTLAWGAIALAAVILLSVNLIAASSLRNVKADLTQQRLFTISKGTREVLRSLDEPITLKLYFSKRLGDVASPYQRYFDRVRNLLQQYRDIAGGKIDLQVFDPEAFSDAEDRAVAAGLRGVRLNQEGDVGYFGIVGSNTTDNDATIAFFTTEREAFVEYDITKLVYTLSNPKKRVVGLISGLPVDGGSNPMAAMMGRPAQQPAQQVMEQIREFFDVKALGQDIKEVPADIDILMIVQPDKLTPDAAYAIDQWTLAGGKVLAFVDPVADLGRQGGPMMMMGPSGPSADFLKVLKGWGVGFDAAQVAGDIAHARRVQFGGGGRPVVTEYVGWMTYDRNAFDVKDVLSSGIERVNLATPGALTKVEGATTQVTPLLVTSQRAMLMPAEAFAMQPDPVALLRTYKPEGKRLMLAARVTGETKSAFPDGAPKPAEEKKDEKKPDGPDAAKDAPKPDAAKEPAKEAPKAAEKPAKPHVGTGRVNAIVIADTDLLSDQFWVEAREFLGQQVAIPTASNAALVVNALDNLGGSEALITLRARGADDRPFTLVADLRRDAERAYREKEQALTQKLKEVQEQLSKLEAGGDAGAALLSESDRHAIERFRADMLNVRRDLREVKRALREDIDRLSNWLQFINIALVPLLIGAGGIAYAVMQRRRRNGGLSPLVAGRTIDGDKP